ncbi:uncharacterized protein LACBIDRAFT_297910 [Laccaria bicolor S238N-H82]|uniref:Predicted protein n=1 Tax=Laccaria bicolor (strain S238N-H82 / ATCC MYA-4686) TaxID=486041 RepID=B0DB68_LACBS|nr:uncharacterized protein LACBIDRAFT_297910 [Laccaria bicolor S238N-H82]EDR08338.1 predicted protein [Laccaria bicolor S238N-H82]|eukprot:XP_001881408.1 predicted protein [Laccaria bicolor S238N-H82]
MEGGPLMLILPFGGVSLFDRGVEQPGNRVTVSESERIHDGGVRHRDIRTPNMLVNGPDVYFIDFDQALLRSPSEGRGEEMADLEDLTGAEPEDSRS